jgi:nanoRNase/pAp phosphatase (c-di-AMP/oligoRNAs hydrolase)
MGERRQVGGGGHKAAAACQLCLARRHLLPETHNLAMQSLHFLSTKLARGVLGAWR